MKMRTQWIRKIALGLILVLLAALLTATLYSILASQNPVDALPTLQVLYKDVPLPQENLMLMSYSWRFLFIVKTGVLQAPDAWRDLKYAPVLPGATLEVVFSYPCESLEISRAAEGDTSFTAVGGELYTPLIMGKYTYRIEANWGLRGSVQYYVNIDVV